MIGVFEVLKVHFIFKYALRAQKSIFNYFPNTFLQRLFFHWKFIETSFEERILFL